MARTTAAGVDGLTIAKNTVQGAKDPVLLSQKQNLLQGALQCPHRVVLPQVLKQESKNMFRICGALHTLVKLICQQV
jgi:hypothetical protein